MPSTLEQAIAAYDGKAVTLLSEARAALEAAAQHEAASVRARVRHLQGRPGAWLGRGAP